MSALTRKHFQRIAGILRRETYHVVIRTDAVKQIAEQLADYFAEENPNFDRKRFLEACGVNP